MPTTSRATASGVDSRAPPTRTLIASTMRCHRNCTCMYRRCRCCWSRANSAACSTSSSSSFLVASSSAFLAARRCFALCFLRLFPRACIMHYTLHIMYVVYNTLCIMYTHQIIITMIRTTTTTNHHHHQQQQQEHLVLL
jgi:hypothetical protein